MLRTVYILWLRELKKFVRKPSRIVGALGQPLLYLLALGYGLGSVFTAAGQGNYVRFLVPGMLGMTLVFTSVFNGMQIIWDRQFGFLKETLVAPVPRTAIMIGRTLGGASVATTQACIVFVLTLSLGFQPVTWPAVIPALMIMLLIATLFSAFGITVASLFTDMQGFQLVMNFVVMPLFFLSGALFPLGEVPFLLNLLAALDPLSYGVDGLRGLLTDTSQFSVPTDVAVLSAIAAVVLALGSYRFTKLEV